MSEEQVKKQNDKVCEINYVIRDGKHRVDLEYSVKSKRSFYREQRQYSVFSLLLDNPYHSNFVENYIDRYKKSYEFFTEAEAEQFLKSITKELKEKDFLIEGRKVEYVETELVFE